MIRFLTTSSIRASLAAFIAGALTVLAFAPFDIWPLQLLTLTLCFALVARAASTSRAALIGWSYGFGWSLFGIHWLFVSMHDFGGMPAWMAALAVALLAAYVGAFYGGVTAAADWLRRKYAMPPVLLATTALPALWALAEWTRGWLFTGFPWLTSGYAHSTGPLAGYAPLIGVYGIGFVAAWIAATVALWPSHRRPALIGLALLVAGFGLRVIDWTEPHGAPISVRLLQGNVPQEMKFAPERIESSLAMYRDMINAAPADLIATPETAIPVLADRLPADYFSSLIDYTARSGSHLLLGVPISDGPNQYANSVLGITPVASNATQRIAKPYRYDKQHLVPFGEFIPPGFRWFVNMMRIPLGDFTRGAVVQKPFAVKDQQVMPNICYEDLFGHEITRQIAAAGSSSAAADGANAAPTMLLNVSNIAWFGDTIALPQHLQISQMRSIETGRPMLRSTNTGATAIVDPKGRVTAQLAPYTRGTLDALVQGMRGTTPYIVTGDAGVVVLSLLLIGIALAVSMRHRAA